MKKRTSIINIGRGIGARRAIALTSVAAMALLSLGIPSIAEAKNKCKMSASRWPETKFVYETDVYLIDVQWDLRGCDIPPFKVKHFRERQYTFPPPVLPGGGGYWIDYNFGFSFVCQPDTLCSIGRVRVKHPAIERARYKTLFVFPSFDGKKIERLTFRHDCTSSLVTASCQEV